MEKTIVMFSQVFKIEALPSIVLFSERVKSFFLHKLVSEEGDHRVSCHKQFR